MSWTGYLSPEELRAVRDTLVNAELFSPEAFSALLSVLPVTYRAVLPSNPGLPAAMRIDQTLTAMNQVVNLRGGEVPLKLVLDRASDYVADAGSRDRLEDLVAEMDSRRPAPTAHRQAAAGGTRAALAPSVTAAGPAATPPEGRLATMLPDPSTAEIDREAMIGEFDETLSVEFLEKGLAAARSVFKIVVHRHFDGEPNFNAGDTPDTSAGTAWVIGPGIGITNFHVFNARTRAEPDAEADDFTKQVATARLIEDYVTEEDDREGHPLGPDRLICFDKTLDFALFRLPDAVGQRPALTVRRQPIRKTEVQKIGTRVNLLQHPMGRPMRIGFRNNFVVLGNNDILAYLTDTNRGSSGAPVLDDAWNVAALHVGSQKISVPDITLMGAEIRRENFGVPVKTILAHVETLAPDVHAEFGGG